MANTSREQLKAWFRRGMKPLQSQFAAWIDSFWHKDDSIPMASVEGLADALNSITVPVDDTISDESENPVQNKVIKEALDGKAATVHHHDEYAGYGDIADLQAQIDLLAQREPSAREVVTVATADDLDDIEEPSTEVIYKTLDESKLWLYDGERFNDVTGQTVDNTIYVNNTGALLSITLDDGVYSVMCTSATPHTYSLSVTGDSRILADKDGWAARVLSSGSYVWQWHRYSYEGHTHSINDIIDYTPPADGQYSVWLNEALEQKTVPNALGAYTISELCGYNVSTAYYSLSSGASHQKITFTNGVATGLEIVVPAGGWIRFEDVGRTVYNTEASIGVKYSRN